MIKVNECLGQQTQGFMLGTLLSRFILAGKGHPRETVDSINHESVRDYLRALVNSNLIIQDQVLSGLEFDPEIEAEFREIASQLLTVLEQVKEKSDESVRWNNSGPKEDS